MMSSRKTSLPVWTALALLLCSPALPHSFVKTAGARFTVDGKAFFVAGVNNHYLPWGSKEEVRRVLDDAVALGANTVRTFLGPVIGALDGATPTIWDWNAKQTSYNLGVHGAYLLYWDPKNNRMAINDGPNGIEKIDFLIAEAGKRNLKLVIAFTDFWAYTGGVQQMRAWYGSPDKNTFFFVDPRPKRDYKQWVAHVVGRVNSITGLTYRDDPTIMAWELMNEANVTPKGLGLSWTAEMAAYVKSLDPNHLVSSGSASILDRLGDLTIPNLDFATWHGYPLYYKQSVQEFNEMIAEFCRKGREVNKPVLLEEFGYARSNADQIQAYTLWLDTMIQKRSCAGWLVWRLASRQDDGEFPPDEHDQFDVRRDDGPLWNLIKAKNEDGIQSRNTP